MPGFSFVEPLRGTFYRLAEPLKELRIQLQLEAHVRKLRFPVASVTGRIRAEGLADDAPVQGTVGLHAVGDRRIPYDVAFVGEDGRRYHLRGEKDLSWLAPIHTLVELPFTIGVEEGAWPEVRGKAAADGPKGTWPEVRGKAAADGPKGTWTEVARGTLHFEPSKEGLRALARSVRVSPF